MLHKAQLLNHRPSVELPGCLLVNLGLGQLDGCFLGCSSRFSAFGEYIILDEVDSQQRDYYYSARACVYVHGLLLEYMGSIPPSRQDGKEVRGISRGFATRLRFKASSTKHPVDFQSLYSRIVDSQDETRHLEN